MQVDPINPKLKAPRIQRLKLKYDKPVSKFAFNFNLRRYNEEVEELLLSVQHKLKMGVPAGPHTPSPFQLNLSRSVPATTD